MLPEDELLSCKIKSPSVAERALPDTTLSVPLPATSEMLALLATQQPLKFVVILPTLSPLLLVVTLKLVAALPTTRPVILPWPTETLPAETPNETPALPDSAPLPVIVNAPALPM